MWEFVYVNTIVLRGQQRVLDPLGLKRQSVVNHPLLGKSSTEFLTAENFL